jgi:murein DD-endopeptidase MepM/ murein hydrolase activator NlpD
MANILGKLYKKASKGVRRRFGKAARRVAWRRTKKNWKKWLGNGILNAAGFLGMLFGAAGRGLLNLFNPKDQKKLASDNREEQRDNQNEDRNTLTEKHNVNRLKKLQKSLSKDIKDSEVLIDKSLVEKSQLLNRNEDLKDRRQRLLSKVAELKTKRNSIPQSDNPKDIKDLYKINSLILSKENEIRDIDLESDKNRFRLLELSSVINELSKKLDLSNTKLSSINEELLTSEIDIENKTKGYKKVADRKFKDTNKKFNWLLAGLALIPLLLTSFSDKIGDILGLNSEDEEDEEDSDESNSNKSSRHNESDESNSNASESSTGDNSGAEEDVDPGMVNAKSYNGETPTFKGIKEGTPMNRAKEAWNMAVYFNKQNPKINPKHIFSMMTIETGNFNSPSARQAMNGHNYGGWKVPGTKKTNNSRGASHAHSIWDTAEEAQQAAYKNFYSPNTKQGRAFAKIKNDLSNFGATLGPQGTGYFTGNPNAYQKQIISMYKSQFPNGGPEEYEGLVGPDEYEGLAGPEDLKDVTTENPKSYELSDNNTTDTLEVTSEYGKRDSEISTNHKGIDIKAKSRQPVVSIREGRVVSVESKGPTSNVLLRNKDNTYYRYMHIKPTVRVGEDINKDQVIGRVNTLEENEDKYLPHIHFEFRDDKGITHDPIKRLSDIEDKTIVERRTKVTQSTAPKPEGIDVSDTGGPEEVDNKLEKTLATIIELTTTNIGLIAKRPMPVKNITVEPNIMEQSSGYNRL